MQPSRRDSTRTPSPLRLLQWYFDLQCRAILYIYIYIFGIFFLVIQIIQWLRFYFGLDSLSQALIFTCFLEGVEREVPEIHPQIRLPLLLLSPHFCAFGHFLRVPPPKDTASPHPSISKHFRMYGIRAGPRGAPSPTSPQAGTQTQSDTSRTCCQRYQNRLPKQCLTCLLVWLWGSPPLLPRGRGPRPQERGGGIQKK